MQHRSDPIDDRTIQIADVFLRAYEAQIETMDAVDDYLGSGRASEALGPLAPMLERAFGDRAPEQKEEHKRLLATAIAVAEAIRFALP